MKHQIERRTYDLDGIEVRAADNGPTTIIGHAAVFNKLSEDLGYFREQIAPGAFKDAIKNDDIRALFNHDSNLILGRNKSGTLRLAEDKTGLAMEIDVPDTQAGRDLVVSMNRGDITQASFGFRVMDQEFETTNDGDIRTLKEVRLFDVSPVVFPAYQETDVALREFRSWQDNKEFRGARLAALLNRLIDARVNDDTTKADVIASMASAAGIDASTVNQILGGAINCPPLNRLQGFARVLGTSLSRLQNAAESDGCEYDQEGNALRCCLSGANSLWREEARKRELDLITS